MARLADAQRQAIADDIQATAGQPDGSVRKIATRHDVSTATVRRIAKAAGLEDAWSRDSTKNATRARVADAAERRAQLAAAMLDDVAFLRDKFRQDWTKTVVVPGVGTSTVEADSAEVATGLQRLMTAVGIAIDKHVALDKHDSADTGADDAKSMLLGVADGLRTLYVASGMADERPSEQDTPGDGSNA